MTWTTIRSMPWQYPTLSKRVERARRIFVSTVFFRSISSSEMGEKGSPVARLPSARSSGGSRGKREDGGGSAVLASGVAGQRAVCRAVRPQAGIFSSLSSGSSSSEESAFAMTCRSSLFKLLLPSSSAMESILPLPKRLGLWVSSAASSASSAMRGASDLTVECERTERGRGGG
jgi:hypothetical protein